MEENEETGIDEFSPHFSRQEHLDMSGARTRKKRDKNMLTNKAVLLLSFPTASARVAPLAACSSGVPTPSWRIGGYEGVGASFLTVPSSSKRANALRTSSFVSFSPIFCVIIFKNSLKSIVPAGTGTAVRVREN